MKPRSQHMGWIPLWQTRLFNHWFKHTNLHPLEHWIVKALARLYGLLLTLRPAPAKARLPGLPPVIVVGNVVMGGTGKTPLVAALCHALIARGHRPGIISRGYGRKNPHEAHIVKSTTSHIQTKVLGDEPVWLARQTQCPVSVNQNRQQALHNLVQHCLDIDIVISDDGLQHTKLTRAFEIIVFDNRGFGNGQLLPAGPLREPLSRLQEVDAIVESVAYNANSKCLSKYISKHQVTAPLYNATVELAGFTRHCDQQHLKLTDFKKIIKNQSLTVLAGMAHPEKFFNVLKQADFQGHYCPLPDHFDYPDNFLSSIKTQFIIVTGKDAVKLEHSDQRVWIADIDVQVPETLIQHIEERLFGH